MGKATAPRAKQIIIRQGKKSLRMAEGTAALGAAKDCLYRVEGAGIGDHHVNLDFNGSVVTVSAAQDAEGITINGKPLGKPQQVKSGDIIAFSTHSFEIGAISNAPGPLRRALGRWYIRVPLYLVSTVFALLLIAFIAAWIYLSPTRISGWITDAVDAQLNCKSSIGSLDYSFSGRVEIVDFKILNKPEYGDGPILQIGRMEAKVSVWDILFSQVHLSFTGTDPKLALHRKMIAGRPSWNFTPLLPPPAPPPPTPPPPVPPAVRGQPIDLGIKLTWLSLAIKNLQITVDDEFMKRKTTATADLTVATDGIGNPLSIGLTCPVDSNGRTGRITVPLEANIFNADGHLDLFTANPPRLRLTTPGDMISSLPLQALIDHLTLPLPTPAGEVDPIYALESLPIEPNLLGSPLTLAVKLLKPGMTDAQGQPVWETVQVPLARLGDLGMTWTNLTVASIDPLAVEIAGAVEIGELGRHRAARLPGEPVGDWVDGDKLHLDLRKVAFDQTAGTLALDLELTVAHAKQGQTLRTRLTAAAAQLDLDALQSGNPQAFNAALRKIQFDNQAQVELNLLPLAASGLGQLALGDRPEAVAAIKSGSLAATVSVKGNPAEGLHLQLGAELKDGSMALTAEKTAANASVTIVTDANLNLSEALLPSLVFVKRLQIDAGLGDNHYTITNLQDLKLAGIDRVLAEKNPAFLVATGEKMQFLNCEKGLIEQINPILRTLFNLELSDTLLVTGNGDLANQKGSIQLAVAVNRIDSAGLSAAAAAPFLFDLGLQIQQLADGKKTLGLTVTGTHGQEFFKLGLQSPPVPDLGDLATAPMTFTPEEAPRMDLALSPLRERLAVYLTQAPELAAQLEVLDFTADPRLALTTQTLTLNQPVSGSSELETRWHFSLGLHGIQDRPTTGKPILPKPTDFNLVCRLNPIYTLSRAAASGGLQMTSLRLGEFNCSMRSEYVTLESDIKVSDIFATFGPDPAIQPVPGSDRPTQNVLLRLPAMFALQGKLQVRQEAYALAAALIKDQAVLRPLTAGQEALLLTWAIDWDRADPVTHDKVMYNLVTQIDPFHAADRFGAQAQFGELRTQFEAIGMLAKLSLPLKPDFNLVEFAFANQSQLVLTTPVSIDQLVLFAHDNAVTLQLDQNDLINMLNTPLSPLAAGGMARVELLLTFDGAQTARARIQLDLNDLYLLIKNEGAMRKLEVVPAKAAVPLLLHESRAKDPRSVPLLVNLAATAEFKNGQLLLRLDDQTSAVHLGPVVTTLGGTIAGKLQNGGLLLQTADFNKAVVIDLALVSGLAPLTTDLNLSGRLHLKTSAQGLDLVKLLAPAAPRPDGAPGLAPLFDPNINTLSYTLFTAPELTVEPKSAPGAKIQLDFKNFTGDLGGNKTGEISLTVAGEHKNTLHLTDLRAVAKPEAGSFVAALESLLLRANLKVGNADPLYLQEMTAVVTPCLKSLGLPEPPPAPTTPPPPGQPLQPGALDFIAPVTANLELDLKNLHYDRYEVDAIKGSAVLDQGVLQMPEPPTATIYGGAATVDLQVQLTGPTPNIPKIRLDIKDLDYNDFFARAFQAPGGVGGKLQVHIEGSGKSAFNPDIDSLDLTVIQTKSENTEITNIAKTPFFGVLWSAAALAFPKALPADPGPIRFGSQTLKNGKLQNGFFTFTEFPFDPIDGPLVGYKLVGEGKIKVMDAHAEYITFKVVAVPEKVMKEFILVARQNLLAEINRQIPKKEYQLTDAELDDAARDMQAALETFMADGKLFVRGRGPLLRPTPEVTPPQAIADLLLKVGSNTAKKKVESILKKIAEEKLKEGIGNLLGPKKKKE